MCVLLCKRYSKRLCHIKTPPLKFYVASSYLYMYVLEGQNATKGSETQRRLGNTQTAAKGS